jgi:hypothetical protein
MTNDDDIIDAWTLGPAHALDRVPVMLRIPVLKRMLAKLEKIKPPVAIATPPKRRRGRPPNHSRSGADDA